MDDEVQLTPIHASGYFRVTPGQEVLQVLVFKYLDPQGYYWSLLETSDKGAIEREKSILSHNMQAALDEERVEFNGKLTRPRVRAVWLEAPTASTAEVTFIITFPAQLRRGVNRYSNLYEEETAEYPYNVVWVMPDGSKILGAKLGAPYKVVGGNILLLHIPRGTRVGGYEEIVFKM